MKLLTKKTLALAAVAAAVIVVTIIALIIPMSAVSETELVLDCAYEVHRHTDECYGEREVTDEEGRPAGTERVLVCGQADYVVHTHDDSCYRETVRVIEDSEGSRRQVAERILVCELPEIPEHVHDSSCYTETRTLVCGREESTGHQHTEECYSQGAGDEPVCGMEEHVHGEECYTETVTTDTELICGHEEGEVISPEVWSEPVYGDPVTDEETGEVISEGELIEEAHLVSEAEIHHHSDACYSTNETAERELSCGREEHTHSEECFGQAGRELICGMEEGEGAHTHTEDCWHTERKLTCGKLELHTHTEECYEKDGNGEPHYGDPAYLICGRTELLAHQHTEECFKEVKLSDENSEENGLEESGEETEGEEGLIPEDGEETEEGTGEEDMEEADGEIPEDEADMVLELETKEQQIVFEGATPYVRVVVMADREAFPEGTMMVVKDVEDEATLEAVTGAAGESNVAGVHAVDITFVTPDGEEVQPAVPIKVTMYSDLATDSDESVVVHVDKEGNAAVVDQLETSGDEEQGPAGEISFETGSE